jgi:hypothetical protein
MAMPLDEMTETLASGDRLRVAEDGELFPNFELRLASKNDGPSTCAPTTTRRGHDDRTN